MAPPFLTKFAKSTFWIVGRFLLPCGVAGLEGKVLGEGGQGGQGGRGPGNGETFHQLHLGLLSPSSSHLGEPHLDQLDQLVICVYVCVCVSVCLSVFVCVCVQTLPGQTGSTG